MKEGAVPVVGSAGINGLHNKSKVSGPGVTLGRSGASIGKVCYVEEDYWPHNTCLFVTDFKGNDVRFISFLLGTVDLSRLNSGAAQPSLNRNYVYKVSVRYPDLRTQREIVSILAAYDDLIANNRRRIALLEEAARLLYREWFVHLRFPGYEHVRVEDGVPEGWERGTLSDLCTDVRESVNPEELAPDTHYVGLAHMPRRSITLQDWGTAEEAGSTKSLSQ